MAYEVYRSKKGLQTPTRSNLLRTRHRFSIDDPHLTPDSHSYLNQPTDQASSPLTSSRFLNLDPVLLLRPNHPTVVMPTSQSKPRPSRPNRAGSESVNCIRQRKRQGGAWTTSIDLKPTHSDSKKPKNAQMISSSTFDFSSPSACLSPSEPPSKASQLLHNVVPSSPSKTPHLSTDTDKPRRSQAVGLIYEREKTALLQKLARAGLVSCGAQATEHQIFWFWPTYPILCVWSCRVHTSAATATQAINRLSSQIQTDRKSTVDMSDLIAMIQLIDGGLSCASAPVCSTATSAPGLHQPIQQFINGFPFTLSTSPLRPTPLASLPVVRKSQSHTPIPSTPRAAQRKRFKIAAGADGSATLVARSADEHDEEEPRRRQPTKYSPDRPSTPAQLSSSSPGLVSAEVAEYGRIAIKAEALVDGLGPQAASAAISRARVSSADNCPEATPSLKQTRRHPTPSLEWFNMGSSSGRKPKAPSIYQPAGDCTRKLLNCFEKMSKTNDTSSTPQTVSPLDEQALFWNSPPAKRVEASHLSLHYPTNCQLVEQLNQHFSGSLASADSNPAFYGLPESLTCAGCGTLKVFISFNTSLNQHWICPNCHLPPPPLPQSSDTSVLISSTPDAQQADAGVDAQLADELFESLIRFEATGPNAETEAFKPGSNIHQSFFALSPSPTLTFNPAPATTIDENTAVERPSIDECVRTPKNSARPRILSSHHQHTDYSPRSPVRPRKILAHHGLNSWDDELSGIGRGTSWLAELDYNRLDDSSHRPSSPSPFAWSQKINPLILSS